MRESEIIGYNRGMRPMLASDLNKVGGTIGSDDEYVRVDRQILPIPTAHVEPDGAIGNIKEEALDDWPWLVAGRGEVRSYLFIDLVNVGFLIFNAIVFIFRDDLIHRINLVPVDC